MVIGSVSRVQVAQVTSITAFWGHGLSSVAPNGPQTRPPPRSLDEIPAGFRVPERSSREYTPGAGCSLGDGAQSGPGGPGRYPGCAPPPPASRTKPLSAAQKRPAREVQDTGRRGGPCPRRLCPSPTGPQAIRSHLPARALPRRVARRSSGGGRRGKPGPRPGRGAASGRRAPHKFTSCRCSPSGQTRGSRPGWPLPSPGWGRIASLPAAVVLPPQRKMVLSPHPQEPTICFPQASGFPAGVALSQSFHNWKSLQGSDASRFSKCSEASLAPA